MSSPTHHKRHQHHFFDLNQQYDSSQLGMWLFLLTEILFFGGLFLAYALYRGMYPDAFADASRQLDILLGGINTAVLIASSFTMVLAVHAAKTSQRNKTTLYLLSTFVLGAVFMVIKYFEYSAKFEHHLVPGPNFAFAGGNLPGHELFYSLYFGMTGLHAFHMIIGMIYLLVLAHKSHHYGSYDKDWNTPVDMVGLYWHFVDIVWIFLFPFLYLIERP